jgi:hypothetical protein
MDEKTIKKEFLKELDTKLIDEKVLKNMSVRDRLNGEEVNKIINELISWVNKQNG